MRAVATGAAGPSTLRGHRPFLFYSSARGLSEVASQVTAVAVGWQIYSLTHSVFALGMVGLLQFIPTLALTFFAGHVADRYERRRVVQICQAGAALTAGLLAWGSFAGHLTVPGVFTAVVVLSIATGMESPAAAALLPAVTPTAMRQQGTAVATGAFQLAAIIGPALGGLAFAVAPGMSYALMAILWSMAAMLYGTIRSNQPATPTLRPTLANLFAGVGFVRHNPAILGTISLDLFAVLLGGATALLPVYAKDILHTGPWGLGLLRCAPAVGALLMTVRLAHHPIERRVGLRMLQAVAIFGVATVVFAISQLLWLSIAALVALGAADTVSMVIRIALVQLGTPDEMRGRVSAVNFLFVNTSYQLGEFESGMTAALLGTVPAALLGGVGTILVALAWMKLFPTLRDVERLE